MNTMSKFFRARFVVALFAVIALWPSPASAHAQLDSSSPAPSSVLESAPSEIRLDFNEPVNPVARSIEIYNQEGQRIVLGEALVSPNDPTVLVAGDVPEIPEGLYVVAWRAVSNDGHAVEGAYSFQIGSSAPIVATDELIANVLSGQNGPNGLSWLMGVAKFAGFLGLCLLLGGLVMVAGGGIGSRRVVGMIGAGWVLAFISVAVLFVAQGPYTTAGSWSDLFDPALWSDVFATRLGKALVGRGVLLLVLLLLLSTLRHHFSRSLGSWWRSSATLVGFGIVVTLSISGHPSASPLSGVASMVDAVHFSSVILWIGGLLTIALGDVVKTAEARSVVDRFSRIATFAIPTAIATGMWQTWHLVPALGNITQTAWGRALLIKTSLVVVAATLGAFARWLIRRDDTRSIRRILTVEALVAVLALGVTAAMVSKSPEETATNAVFSTQLVAGDVIASVAVAPGRVGNNEIHLTVSTPNGSLSPVSGVTMRLTLPGSEIPTITAAVSELGLNHFVGTVAILTPGIWNLEILVEPDPSSSTRLTTEVPVTG